MVTIAKTIVNLYLNESYCLLAEDAFDGKSRSFTTVAFPEKNSEC